MHFEDLRQIHKSYDHVYLSPHLDDAALSCGGAIARYSALGARVLVVTICTAPPSAITPFSIFAKEMHIKWGLPAVQAVEARLHEDILAMEQLGADSYWAGMYDAIYRYPEDYNSEQALFAAPIAGDTLFPTLRQLIRALRSRLPQATFYAPLGVGNHVDHQITYNAALAAAGSMLAFYEDFPYVREPGLLERRLADVSDTLVPSTIAIDTTLRRKIGAIDAYASQIGVLFGDSDSMARAVMDYAEELRPEVGTYAERLWLRYAQS